MSEESPSKFSAEDAALGYLYQIRCALLLSLRRLKTQPNFIVSVESLDDVAFEVSGGDPSDLLQTKHHRKSVGALTNASPDLWKTLRIWFEGCASGLIPSEANLWLITTGTAPAGSAARRLRSFAEDRDVLLAQQALAETASSSRNQENASAYKAFLSLDTSARSSILERITIIDAAPSINDLDGELRQEIYFIATKNHLPAFLDRLEGWWLRRIIQQLTGAPNDRISSDELESHMSDLRDQFRQDSLPIDDDLLRFTLDDATRAAHEDTVFVKQLELVKAGKRRIANAIRDYYRAFEQRSRWVRDDLVIGLDLSNYEKRLAEEWEIVFEAMRDELGDSATDGSKEEAARSVLAWAERVAIHIRPDVTEPFVSRGSLFMLSDDVRIGWHPEFRERLTSLLGSTRREP